MTRWIILGALASLAAPAAAQGTYRERYVTVYGDEACPKSTNPDEIVVCARRPEAERYRLPRGVREQEAAQIDRRDNVAEQRDQLASGRDSASGIGSCSPSGAGGIIGCTKGLSVGNAVRVIREGIARATDPIDK